mgnify:FL=1
MKKRVMALLLAASLAATVFAGCGSSKDTDKSNDTKTTTESQSEEKDTSKDAASGKTDDGKYVDVDAYLADETIKSQLDKALSSTEDGINMEVLSDKDTLIYKYTFAEQLVTEDGDAETAKASFEKAVAQQDASMQSVANSLTTYIDQDPIKVKIEYVDADGTTLYEKEYTSGN